MRVVFLVIDEGGVFPNNLVRCARQLQLHGEAHWQQLPSILTPREQAKQCLFPQHPLHFFISLSRSLRDRNHGGSPTPRREPETTEGARNHGVTPTEGSQRRGPNGESAFGRLVDFASAFRAAKESGWCFDISLYILYF